MSDTVFIDHRSRSVGYYLLPYHVPMTFWRHRQLIWQLIVRNVSSRYRGSVLGLFWSMIIPLMMLLIYTFVFGVVMNVRWGRGAPPSTAEFALTLFSGLIVFNVFSESVTASSSVIIGNVSFVKKVVFPLEILPIVSFGAAMVNALISLSVMLGGIAVFAHKFPPLFYYYPLILLPLAMICVGMGWFLASIGVFIRDVGHAVGIVVQMLFFLTPLFYTIEQMPPGFQSVMRANPLSVIVESSRRIMMYDKPPDWLWLGGVTVISLVVMQLGFVWFMKTKRGFADVL